MTEKTISFTAEMVRAVLDDRKTQHRFVMKPQPAHDIKRHTFPNEKSQGWISSRKHSYGATTAHLFPYGKPGDLLWVREPWQAYAALDNLKPSEIPPGSDILYLSDRPDTPWDAKKRQAIFMPRWASRITLKITDVRVERVQNISEGDARAEGCPYPAEWAGRYVDRDETAKTWFKTEWRLIHGNDPVKSWDANPWVWVIEFERVK